MKPPFFIGVDVGTKSVRAALVSSTDIICTEEISISVLNSKPDFYEQNSQEIWDAVGVAVKKATSCITNKSEIKGIGFDGTCSLVLLDDDFKGVPTCPEGKNDFNIVMWMDHRAKEEVEIVNKNPCRVHDYVGGTIFIEMNIPKLLWVKRNHPEGWKKTRHIMDLPDFLTFKATSKTSRSLCSLVCKYTYICDGNSQGWDDAFLTSIGLEDLIQDNYKKLGNEVLYPGKKCGMLTEEAASHLGLEVGTAVGASLLDAHAGGLALVSINARRQEDFIGKLALICGTSTCHMCVSKEATFVKGVWGPYWSAMLPHLWLNEGGQSATGALIDHVLWGHSAAKQCPPDVSIYEWLEGVLLKLQQKKPHLKNVSLLTSDLHVYPDFHGNRSPLADSDMKGMICGLTLDKGVEDLALLFLATIQAIAYGTKDITDQLISSGQKITTLVMCGGLSKSRLFIQTHADALGMPIWIPTLKEAVLFGAAMLGASASGHFGPPGELTPVALSMGGGATTFEPDPEMAGFHEKKFKVFKKMQSDVKAYDNIMRE